MKNLHSFRFLRLLGLTGALVLASSALWGADYEASVEQKRQGRLERLTSTDSWLTLIGLHWLKVGENTIGTATTNQVVLRVGPEQFGTVILAPEGAVQFRGAGGEPIEVDGKRLQAGEVVGLVDDQREGVKPTRVRAGTVSFHLIHRSGKLGLRVRDVNAATRTGFLGLDYFPIDPQWRVEARWVPFSEPRVLKVVNILGDVETEQATGKAVFEWAGHKVEMVPMWDGNPEEPLFFVIADATSGEETYGAARFVYAEPPKDGKVWIDFNLALNPPCAFTPYATCPLPPKENVLPFAVRAGEKRYRGEPAH